MIPDDDFTRDHLRRLARAQVDIQSAAAWMASQYSHVEGLTPETAEKCLVVGWAAEFYEREMVAGLADVQMEAYRVAIEAPRDRGQANAKLKAISDFLFQHKGYAKDGTSAKAIKQAEKLLESLPPEQRKQVDNVLKILSGKG